MFLARTDSWQHGQLGLEDRKPFLELALEVKSISECRHSVYPRHVSLRPDHRVDPRLRLTNIRLPARPTERVKYDAVVALLAQTARLPPLKSRKKRCVAQIILLTLREQDFRLLRQA
jgi:hypothetical protein